MLVSSMLESDVYYHVRVAPSGESYGDKRRPGQKVMATYSRVDVLKSPAGLLPVHRDQLQAQSSVMSMGKLYFFAILC